MGKRFDKFAAWAKESEAKAREKQIERNTTCPKCKSKEIQPVGKDKAGFSTGKAVGGVLLTGGVGLLAGFAGKDKGVQFYCKECGHIWTRQA